MSRDARIAKLTQHGMSRPLAENYVDREHGWAYIKVRPYWHRRIAEHAKATGQSAGDEDCDEVFGFGVSVGRNGALSTARAINSQLFFIFKRRCQAVVSILSSQVS